MTDLKNDSAARWAAATQLAEGVTDDGFHKRRARILLQVGVLIAVSWATGFIVALLFLPKSSSSTSASSDEGSGQLIVQIVFLSLGLLVGVVGFIWAKHTGHYSTRWRAVSSPLNRQEKKSVRKQINGKVEPDTEHLPVVVAIGKQNRLATLGIAPIYAALVLLAIATAVGSNVMFIKFTELGVSVLFVVVAVQLVVFYRKAGRFIDRHGRQSV